jgi:predicted DsbA family dithiol-disulfide isomerase
MLRAHFGQARELWTMGEVLDFAEEMGLDRGEAAQALRERRYRPQVEADQREAQRLGARGAPFLVIDGKYAIPGAVDTGQLLDTITQAWQESHPAVPPLTVVGETEGLCGPDGCFLPQHSAH